MSNADLIEEARNQVAHIHDKSRRESLIENLALALGDAEQTIRGLRELRCDTEDRLREAGAWHSKAESLTEQLVAAQAVITEALRLVPIDTAGAYDTLSQSTVDALAAHDREVAAKAWDDGLASAVANGYQARNGLIPNPYRNTGEVS